MPSNAKHSVNPHARLAASAARGVRVTMIGILVSAALAAIKIIAGIVGSAYVLIADGIESVMDVVSALVVLGALRLSAAPPNERYPYGYGKAEPLGAIVVSSGLFLAAGGIAVQSLREIRMVHRMPASWTLIVLVVVVIAKELMFRFLSRTGVSIGSKAVATDAWHHRSDALTSTAAFVGISVALIGGPRYAAADDWAALFACGIISYNGYKLFRSALQDVMDAAPPSAVEHQVRRVASAVAGVEEVDKCLVRKSGLGYFVDLHIEVDALLPVRDGHEIAHRVKDALLASDLSILDVSLHVEPHPNPYKLSGK